MNSTVLLRIAAIIILLNGVGHTVGLVTRKNKPGAEMQEVIHQMEAHKFAIGGSMRSWDDAYAGNSAVVSVTLFVIAAMLWVLGGQARNNTKLAVPILLLLLVAFVANTIISIQYFFIVPTLFQLAAGVLVGISIVRLRKVS